MNSSIVLNSRTIASIEHITGMRYGDIIGMDSDALTESIQHKTGKRLKFRPIYDSRLLGRGSVYVYLHRLFDFRTKKLDRYIDRLR